MDAGAESRAASGARASIGHGSAQIKAFGTIKGRRHGKPDRPGKNPVRRGGAR